ncbi:ABC-2 type transport system ATP-binding protein [Tessaracoccus bendigoensis DSM 12906]|uniref:ABC-2 type transport system ATP-binding protein n=1 Tax=Tessaracoccus bendigoensis DSM 12906 TaxID=1123357 RepID=A0A1M6BJN3_9ACTN|nr:ABC transporter ATP-binding protein [Tessaracoccus bendigoensis]SHI48990.1 ABC-2 type transport system ATP-binding protein [Tessaracoccus bendigoensis DSM 12906]
MPIISVESVRKTFGEVLAIDDLTFAVDENEIFGILGPNGAGKTTTVECIAGTITPDRGQVTVLGADPARQRSLVRERVGYQLQSTALPPALRVGEAMELFAAFYESPADVGSMLDLVGMTGERRRPFGKLSGGQQQRLSIALALVGQPQVAVFDELTTGLDPQGRRDAWQLIEQIRNRGITVILVTHFLDEAERLCDRIAIIDKGRSRFIGSPTELMDATPHASTSPHRLEDAYLRLLDQDTASTARGM